MSAQAISTNLGVKVVNHPLAQNILTRLRDYQTPTSEFRQKALQLSYFLVYEAAADLNSRQTGVETPIGPAMGITLSDYIILAPVLRAGLIISEAAQELLPNARIYHVGLRRDEQTLQAIPYYSRLPEVLPGESSVFILESYVSYRRLGYSGYKFVCGIESKNYQMVSFVSSPEGIAKVHKAFPQVKIITGSIDAQLNEHGYIVPGLGDAGDRIFGT